MKALRSARGKGGLSKALACPPPPSGVNACPRLLACLTARRSANRGHSDDRRSPACSSAPETSEYYPVLFTATEDVNSPVYGLDLNDGGVRQQTLERARDTDAIATSPLFTLQSGTGHRRGFFVALPVYAADLPHKTLDERIRNLRGYVLAVFQTSVLMETILTTTRKPAGFDLYFYPADGAQKNALLYFHGSRLRDTPTEPVPRAELNAVPH